MECQADDDGTLQFRNQHWAFKSEPLQTVLIYDVYTFILINHTDQYNIYSILIYDFFWLEMFNDVH